MSQGSNVSELQYVNQWEWVSVMVQWSQRESRRWIITWPKGTWEGKGAQVYMWLRWSKWDHVVRKRESGHYIHLSFRRIVHLSQDLIVDDDNSGVQPGFGLWLQRCVAQSIHDNSGHSSYCQSGVCLSIVRAVHKTVNVCIACVFQADKTTSSSNACAILVWFHTILREVAESLTELAEVLLRSNVPC